MSALARHLISHPPLDDVAEFIFALLCFPLGATEVVITGRYESGELNVVGRFPLHPMTPLERAGLYASDEVCAAAQEAVKRGGPSLWTDQPSPAERRGTARYLAAWPLGCPADPDAFLVVELADEMDPAVVAERLRGLAEVLALYVLRPDAPDAWRIGARRSHLAPPVTVATGTSSVSSHEGLSLTSRQCRILHLLAHGLTNPQIAARIGFSTSTVRLETLKIFRALGVHDRKRAVEAADALGLLVIDDPSREPVCAARTA